MSPHHTDTADGPDAELIRLLAAGREEALQAALDAGGGADPLVAEIVRADAAARTLAIDLFQLHALRERVAASPRAEELGPWVDAIIAGHQFLDGDVAGMVLAFTTLQGLPDEVMLPVPQLFARGRICRQIAIGYVLVGGAGADEECLRMRDQSVRDYLRCGFRGEAAITMGLVAGLRAQTGGDDPPEAIELIGDALATIGDPETTMWAPVLEGLRCGLGWWCGDFAQAREARDVVDRLPVSHPISQIWSGLYGLFMDLEETGDLGLVPAIDEGIAAAGEISVRHPMLASQYAAHVLCDLGSPEARRFARPLYETAFGDAPGSPEAELLRIRVDASGGAPVAEADAMRQLAALDDGGRTRLAADFALRLARDADRSGPEGFGDALRRWGIERLPEARHRWTPREVRFSRPATADEVIGGSRPKGEVARADQAGPVGASANEAPVALRVLAPTVEATVGAAPVPLQTAAATLLVVLAAAHPAPVHVEQLADILWPDASLASARTRLNTLAYRLRRSLGDGVVRRTGELVALDPAVAVDLTRFREAMRGPRDGRLQALTVVRGNLAHTQLPYVERLEEERRAVGELWLSQAREAVQDGVDPSELEPALTALGLTAAELSA